MRISIEGKLSITTSPVKTTEVNSIKIVTGKSHNHRDSSSTFFLYLFELVNFLCSFLVSVSDFPRLPGVS